jgi:uridylate kinase
MTEDGMIIKLSGTRIYRPDNTINAEYLAYFAKNVRGLRGDYRLGVVPGGGPFCREVIGAGRKFGLNSAQSDMLARYVLRLSCGLMIAALGDDAYPIPVDDIDISRLAFDTGKIPVLTGNFPGQSSDNMAVQYAGYNGIRNLVKLTEVGAVYNRDPKRFEDTRPLPRMTHQELTELVQDDQRTAGNSSVIFDLLGARGLANNAIRLYLLKPDQLEMLSQLLKGEIQIGTVVGE